MESTRLELDTKNRRRVKECPCGKSNRDVKFVPYKGYDDAGYCHSCGETFLPKGTAQVRQYQPKPEPEILVTPVETVAESQSITGYDNNPFVLFLFDLASSGFFSFDDLFRTLEMYHVGTTKDLKTVFWLMDLSRSFAYTGQIIPYDRNTGKRIKPDNPNVPHVQWAHTRLNIPNESTRKPLFGLSALAFPGNEYKPVGIMESPKSAVIASIYYGDAMVFLATYGKHGCRLTDRNNCKPLIGKSVTMYPDLKAYDDWCKRAEHLRTNGVRDVTVSTVMIDNATPEDWRDGNDPDFADLLLRYRKSELRDNQNQAA